MYHVYILRSELKGQYYVGSTNDLERRFDEHNSGLSRYTKPLRPWSLVYNESFKSLDEALIREKELKSWKSRSRLEELFRLPR